MGYSIVVRLSSVDKNYCTGFNASLITNDKSGNFLIYRPRCKQWSCPYCAIQNMKLWRYRIMLECEETLQNVWFFWTVTLDGDDHKTESPQVDSLKKWRSVWDKLMKRVRRDMKKLHGKMRYVRVFESHKSGVLHVHMLTDVAYPDIQEERQYNAITKVNDIVWRSSTLQAHLTDLGLGRIHDIRPINTENENDNGVARNVSSYVTKYLTKDIQSDMRQLLKNAGMSRIRIIQTSQSFGVVANEHDQLNWSLGRLSKIAHDSLPSGSHASDISRGRVVDDSDFYDFDQYPNQYSDLQWLAELQEFDET